MADLGLQSFTKLYPMVIKKYQDLVVDQNASEKDKINDIIQKLNALGKLSNDVVRDWNTVYQWAMNDGLSQDVSNKIEEMKANGELNTVLQGVFLALAGDMTTLHTSAKNTLVASINEVDDLAKANQTAIATNTANIATNTANIATNTTNIASNTSALAQKATQADLTQITKLPSDPSGTDDTTSLQAMINGLTDGDTLTLKDGTYIVTSLTITKNNITIKGKNTIIQCKNLIGSYSPFVSVTGTNVKIENVTFDLNNKACYGVAVISGSENVRLENCVVQNGYNDGSINSMVVGISIQDNSKRIYVNNCVVKNMIATANGTVGDNIGASRAILVNSSVSTNLSSDVYITNCKIDNIQPVEDGDGIQVTSQSSTTITRVVIEKCTFTNCAKRFVKTNVMGTIIKDNDMYNSSASTDGTNRTDSMFSAISAYYSNIDIINNKIHGNSFYHVIDMDMGSATSVLQNIKILDNYISIMESSSVTTNLGNIHIYAKASNIIIRGNYIKNGVHGVYLRGDIDTVVISNNIITGVTTNGVILDSFNVVNMNNISIMSNIINSSNNGIAAKYGTPSVTGNVVKAGSGFGAFDNNNITNVSKSANVGNGSFVTNATIVSSLPSLRSTTFDYGHQGALVLVSNAGSQDLLYMCVKLADNTYGWKQITLT